MTLTNTMELTESQESTLRQMVKGLFESKVSEDFWHFSFEGTRLNLKSKNIQCVFEVHCDKGSFNVLIDLNEKKKGLKSTFKIVEL